MIRRTSRSTLRGKSGITAETPGLAGWKRHELRLESPEWRLYVMFFGREFRVLLTPGVGRTAVSVDVEDEGQWLVVYADFAPNYHPDLPGTPIPWSQHLLLGLEQIFLWLEAVSEQQKYRYSTSRMWVQYMFTETKIELTALEGGHGIGTVYMEERGTWVRQYTYGIDPDAKLFNDGVSWLIRTIAARRGVGL